MIRLHAYRWPAGTVEHERRARVSRWGAYLVLGRWAYVLTWWTP